ncbi:MAG TPA: SDR family oxidoreductase [Candidatus Saccharimonadales bacterium]|nr:SDR family oxidoreductase [Candidatus Saccharimonadales bacterium]
MTPLKGRVALVTGGGQGLGAAICRTLAEAGARVVVADMNQTGADQVAAEIKTKGQSSRALRLDVSDQDSAAEAVTAVTQALGQLDILVNNAGVDFTKSLDELSIAEWDKVLGVNLRGPFLMSKLAFAAMAKADGGHIVNIISTAAKRTWANTSAYHASKWGLLGLSHALHVEGRAHQIKVSAVVAGGMRTPFILERFPDVDQSTLQDPQNVADTIAFILTQPKETVIPEVMVLPVNESSWP